MEDITDADYNYLKRVSKYFKTKKLREYYDSRVQSDTLLLADVFENFRNTCLEICDLDLAKISFNSRITLRSLIDGGVKW